MTCPTCGVNVTGGTHIRDCAQTNYCWCKTPEINAWDMCIHCLRPNQAAVYARHGWSLP